MRTYGSIVECLQNIEGLHEKIIGVSGGSCSGKTYFSALLAKKLNGSVLSMDDYYKGRSRMKNDDFDSPEAIDLDLWERHLTAVKKGSVIQRPSYDFTLRERTGEGEWRPVFPVVAEGLFSLLSPQSEILDLKIFIFAEDTVALQRRVARDLGTRESDESKIRERWERFVRPRYQQSIACQYKSADIVVLNSCFLSAESHPRETGRDVD